MIQFNHLLNLEFALPSILVECVHPVSTEETQILEKKIISRHYCLFFEDTVMVREAARPRLVSVVALRLRLIKRTKHWRYKSVAQRFWIKVSWRGKDAPHFHTTIKKNMI